MYIELISSIRDLKKLKSETWNEKSIIWWKKSNGSVHVRNIKIT